MIGPVATPIDEHTNKIKPNQTKLTSKQESLTCPVASGQGKKGIYCCGWLSLKGTLPKKNEKRAPLGSWEAKQAIKQARQGNTRNQDGQPFVFKKAAA